MNFSLEDDINVLELQERPELTQVTRPIAKLALNDGRSTVKGHLAV
jgi:hypothetical protein